MNIKLIRTLIVLSIASTFQGTSSNILPQKSSLECVLFDDKFYKEDCAILCERSESSSNHQECSIKILGLNEPKMFIDVAEKFQIEVQNLTLEDDTVLFLPLGIHKVLPNLLEIEAHSTSIKIASKEHFEKLTKLTALRIINSELTDICGTAFHDLTSLTEINLSVNEIKFLHPNLFKENLQLQNIDLNGNSIEILHPELFSKLHQLSVLILSFNALTFIDNRQFSHNKQLSELHLDSNNIKAIEYGAFEGLDSLLMLAIEYNPCTNDFQSEFDDEGMNMNVTMKFVNENCGKIGENQNEIEEKINMHNKWFGSKYVADKCGSDDKGDYVPFYLRSSGVKLHLGYQIWVLVSVIRVLNVNYLKF